MPRVCFFPILRETLIQTSVQTLLAVYTQPQRYNPRPLSTEPTGAIVLPGFDSMAHRARLRVKVGWIPILGFGAYFAKTIYESLVDTYDLGDRIFPLVGYPAFEPAFFDRVLNDSARVVIDAVKSGGVREQFLYADAADPFETRQVIKRLITPWGSTVSWVGSPMGPKPMGLGMLLCALEEPITVMIAQARSYHPDYSHGEGPLHIYGLKHHGTRMY